MKLEETKKVLWDLKQEIESYALTPVSIKRIKAIQFILCKYNELEERCKLQEKIFEEIKELLGDLT